MAKSKVGQVNEYTGRVETRTVSRGRGGERSIPWTAGPKNRWQKLKRRAVG